MDLLYRRRGAGLSDRPPGNYLAMLEVLLCLVLFVACSLHVRLRFSNARAAAAAGVTAHETQSP